MIPEILNRRYDAIHADAVDCSRPSKWSNPFIIGVHGTRDDVCDLYEEWFPQQPDLMAALWEIEGRDLVCWCEPKRCHCRTLLRYANDRSLWP